MASEQTWEEKAIEVIRSMTPAWFRDVNDKRLFSPKDRRTQKEASFDKGVFAAAEFIRRMTKDEDLALQVHSLCFWHQYKAKQESESG